MKRSFLLLGLVAFSVLADEPPPRRMIALDAGNLAYQAIVSKGATIPIFASYEAAIADHISLFGTPGVIINSNAPLNFGLGIGVNFYPFSYALSAFYIGPQFNLLYGSATTSGATANLGIGLAANAGLNLVVGSLIIGPGISVAMSGLGSSTLTFAFAPKLNIGFGF